MYTNIITLGQTAASDAGAKTADAVGGVATKMTSWMPDWALGLIDKLGPLWNILLVLVILWVGKIVAKKIGKLVEKALSKTQIDDKLAAKVGYDANVSKGIAGFVVALVMLFVLIFALGMAGLDSVSEPLRNILDDVLGFIPNVLLAGLMTYIVVMIAGIIKQLLSGVLSASKIDERLGSVAGTAPISNAICTAAYAFFLLLFTPAILDVLGIEAVSKPIKGIVSQITGSVDNILIAGVIIFIGCLIANIAKRLVTNLLQATNVDSFPEKLGLSMPTTGSSAISSIAGTVVMISVIILALTSAIKELNIDILSDASTNLYSGYFNILTALIILAVGVIASRFAYDKLKDGNEGLAKVAKYGIITLTSVVALNRTGLAPELTGLPYTVAIYAVGVAVGIGGAIAIGFGAQGFMARWFDKRG